jgi:hypothetical protein
MRRSLVKLFSAIAGLGLFAASASAATVTLTIVATPTGGGSTGTWQAFAQIGDGSDNAGLADFSIDVLGGGAVAVTTSPSANKSPQIFNGTDLSGFSLSRLQGTLSGGNLTTIAAAQQFAYGSVNDPAADAKVFQGVGLTAGSRDYTGDGGGAGSWASPVLLASGNYSNSGLGGTLTLQVHPGGSIDVLPLTGGQWVGPSNSVAATVVPGLATIAPVPEPTSLALLGLGSACLLARRRRMA